MLGFTAGTILSTKSIPYRLLGLNGVFLLFDAILNSPYTYIAKYTTLIGIGSYCIVKDNTVFNHFAKILHNSVQKQMGIEVEETEEEEEDIYADMPPLISLEQIAAEVAKAVEAAEAAKAVEAEAAKAVEAEAAKAVEAEAAKAVEAEVAKAAEVAKVVAEVPLPPSPLDTDDDLPPPFIPVPDTALMLPVEEIVPEEFVPVYKVE